MHTVAESYYAARSRRDPEWHAAQRAGALERERDPEGFRRARREATARTRARQVAHGFTFTELLRRSPAEDAETLRLVLNDEVRRGRIDYCGSSRRYVLNGGLPDDVRLALRDF